MRLVCTQEPDGVREQGPQHYQRRHSQPNPLPLGGRVHPIPSRGGRGGRWFEAIYDFVSGLKGAYWFIHKLVTILEKLGTNNFEPAPLKSNLENY